MQETTIFDGLITGAKEVMGKLSDKRMASNATKYTMESAGMGALSIFMMQDPSFLSHQTRLARGTSTHNFRSLFSCEDIPTPNQIRNLLDGVEASELESLYHNGLEALEKHGGLQKFKYLQNSYLIALDGTGFHSSDTIHCCNCTVKIRKDKSGNDKTEYSHSMLAAAIVSPEEKEAIALVPEFITPQDGHDKQDCENAAIKRWLVKHSKNYSHLNPTILGDDLLSRQPICEAIIKEKYHFILTCKPDSHTTLYEYMERITINKAKFNVKKKNGKKYIYQYKYMAQLPLRDSEDALLVNWFEITEIEEKTGKSIYKNSFITDHEINQENIQQLALAARSRWRIENENNNTLKTKGYHFQHNFGHGKNNLSMIFASLAVVAFLYHTVMNIVDLIYIKAKEVQGTRINFFNVIKAIAANLVFKSWNNLMIFLTAPPDPFSIGEF